MMILILILISFLPIFLLGLYIYKKDSVKEPKSLLMGLFASGFLAAFITVVISTLFIFLFPEFYLADNYDNFNFITLFILIFLQIALVEEFLKWIMIRNLGFNRKEFDQLYDIIVYAVFVSLGFAAIENLFYVVDGGAVVGLYRAIFSVPGHACFGVFMGYFLGLAKISYVNKDMFRYKKNMIFSIMIPALLHTVFNFCLMCDNGCVLLIFLGFIIILYVSAILKVNKFAEACDEAIN